MPRCTSEEYLSTMAATDGQPLLHTVVFESIKGPNHEIERADDLAAAILGMRNISGVSSLMVRRALNAPRIIEQLVVENNTRLQGLRTDSDHDAVIAIAGQYANWRVIDRLVPEPFYQEPRVIQAGANAGSAVARQIIVSFHDNTPDTKIEEFLGQYRVLAGDAEGDLLVPAEVSRGLDRRKGDVAIVREIWPDLASAQAAEQSVGYLQIVQNIGDIATQDTALYYAA